MKNYKKKNWYALTIISKEQKITTFTTIFRVKECYFHYDFACKEVPLSLRYAKNKNKLCTFLDGSVGMEKNKLENKQSSVTSIKWLCARCGNCGNG
jgi:hypothetical protein